MASSEPARSVVGTVAAPATGGRRRSTRRRQRDGRVAVPGARRRLPPALLRLSDRAERRHELPGVHERRSSPERPPGSASTTTSTVIRINLFPTTVINTALFTVGSIVGSVHHRNGARALLQAPVPARRVLRALLLLPWLLPLIASDRRVEVDPRPGQRRPEPGAPVLPHHLRSDSVAEQPSRRPRLGDPREHLARHPVQRHDPLRRTSGHPRRALRGGGPRRRHRLEGVRATSPGRTFVPWSRSFWSWAWSTRSRCST